MRKPLSIGVFVEKKAILMNRSKKIIVYRIFNGFLIFSLCFIYFWYLILQSSEQQQLSLVPS
ncbi:hypothetical protein P5E92_01480 [Clostridium perfringens]|nr:hypothetical protein [Clostridium perfringens]